MTSSADVRIPDGDFSFLPSGALRINCGFGDGFQVVLGENDALLGITEHIRVYDNPIGFELPPLETHKVQNILEEK